MDPGASLWDRAVSVEPSRPTHRRSNPPPPERLTAPMSAITAASLRTHLPQPARRLPRRLGPPARLQLVPRLVPMSAITAREAMPPISREEPPLRTNPLGRAQLP